ncbi:MAG: metal ABC transporter ATP-binding protein [Syntrophorhabdaceae bacterium]|nr:metal ABC transporter ATP-binding protein [Syntrophorhabdaceae bacterium]
MKETENVISMQNVYFSYNSAEVLSGVSFDLKKGAFLGIVGPNGSGKTTLIRLMLGFLKPQIGDIYLFGQPAFLFKDWHRIGYLPQKTSFSDNHFPAKVKEIVALGLLSKKRSPKRIFREDLRIIDKYLDLFGIIDLKEKFIGELSGGQRQRVLLAKAMVNEPELLILDEPTTALDPETRERFFDILKEINNKKAMTIIMITHDIGTIGRYASNMLYLDKRVIFFGTFESFCNSNDMTEYFGEFAQHLICHRHDTGDIYKKSYGRI